MRRLSRLAVTGIVAAIWSVLCSSARADITNWAFWTPSGDGVTATPSNWQNPSQGDYSVSLTGTQSGDGMVDGSFTTSGGDPNLFIDNTINNDTGFPWSSYEVDVVMPNVFTLSGIQANTPNTWTYSVISPEGLNGSGPYVGQYEEKLDFFGTPNIAVGGIFDFQYELSFAGGAGSIAFTQVLTPTEVPEPASFSLLAMAGMGLLGRRRRAAR